HAAWVGFKQTTIEFDRPKRVAGETHYTLKSMVNLARAGVFPNTEYTLTFPVKLGLLLGFLSGACLLTFIVLACCGINFGGLTAWLFPTMGAFSAIILFCQGIANIHVGMIYKEVQNRPQYIVTDRYNLDE
ncbi:MAG: hypothetical protein J6A46_03360, partial [Clostridia bacterium]|nr:hypothetical protein [Clostridia bacterium]